MKLSKVVFTHPTQVFGGESVSVLLVPDAPEAPRAGGFVDSIEVTPLGLRITRGELVAWVPSEAAESGQVVPASQPPKGKGA